MATEMLEKILDAEKDTKDKILAAEKEAQSLINDAEKKAEELIIKAKNDAEAKSKNDIAKSENDAKVHIEQKKSLAFSDADKLNENIKAKLANCKKIVLDAILA